MLYKSDLFWLRKPLISDAKQLYEISQNKDVMAYYGTKPFVNFQQARDEISWFQTLEITKQGFRWIITDTKNQCIGSLGCFNYDKERASYEISYQLHQMYWNKGIMTKAIRELQQHVLSKTPARFIIAYVNEDNIGSQKVLIKNGFELVQNFSPAPSDWDRLKNCYMYLWNRG